MGQIWLALGFLARMIASCVVFGALAAFLVFVPFSAIYDITVPRWWHPLALGAELGLCFGSLIGLIILPLLLDVKIKRKDRLHVAFRLGVGITVPFACGCYYFVPLYNETGVCSSLLLTILIVAFSARQAAAWYLPRLEKSVEE